MGKSTGGGSGRSTSRNNYSGLSAQQLGNRIGEYINRGESAPRGLRRAYQTAIRRDVQAQEAAARARGERAGGAVFGNVRRSGNLFA